MKMEHANRSRVDAHQHFWHFDPDRDTWITEGSMSAIRHDFMPEDLAPILKNNNFEGCIVVQTDQSEGETRFLLNLADKHDFIKGVVGWLDLKADNLGSKLDYFSQFPKLKGFRHILQDEKPEFMLNHKFIKGVRLLGDKGFTYDILVYPKQLIALKNFLKKCENQPFALDHMAKPYIKNRLLNRWAIDIKAIAEHENVYCKISGLVTEADWQNWQEKDFRPYLDVVFEAFGADRIMYGSDWPVCLVAATYEKQLSIVENYVSKYANMVHPDISGTEGCKIFGENARRFYKI